MQQPRRGFWYSALRIDRRYIFVLVFVSLTVPFLFPGMRVAVEVQNPARQVYDFVDGLKEGDGVLVAFEYSPSTAPELTPMATCIARQCFQKGVRVYALSSAPEGPPIAAEVFRRVAGDYGRTEGEDYVNLGYKPGGVQAIVLGLAQNVSSVFPTDYVGTAVADIPAMRYFKKLSDLKLCVALSASTVAETWMGLASARFGVPVATGVTGVMVANFYAYLDTGQLVGLLGGMKGAAEYERLIAENVDPEHGYWFATRGMASQSASHVLIVLFVLFGNLAMVMSGRGQRRRRR